MSTFVDPSALCEAASIGEGSCVLAYARVGPGVALGRNCAVHEHAVLLGRVALEDGVTVQTGAQLLGAVSVEQGASIGAGAVLGAGSEEEGIIVRRFASVGANVTVLPGVTVGRRAVVEPGTVVTQDVPANAIVSGNPATIVAYVDSGLAQSAGEALAPSFAADPTFTGIHGVAVRRLTTAQDLRGSLIATEFDALPFEPQRIFAVYDVPSESVRGAHAHRVCSQFLICVAGAVNCLVDDGSARGEVRLASPDVGLHIPPMIWGTQWRYSRDAILLVLASHPYDPLDYIRDYEEFLEELEGPTSMPSS